VGAIASAIALLGRVEAAIGFAASDMAGEECPKPEHLADKSWPHPMSNPEPPLPTITQRKVTLDCKSS
jgi:hypothetical protein